jgi:hypothetical protein
MNERDNGSETVEDAGESVPGLSNEQGDNESNGEDDDAEDRPISIDLTRAEALTLLHVAWEREIEMSGERSTAGLSQLIGSVGTQVGKEIYGPEMAEWLEEKEEEREEMVEEMMDQVGGPFDNDNSGTNGFGVQ